MNKVITINLDGIAYQLEEDGYAALHSYLENAAARLQGNPDRDEILADIERAMADKFRTLLNSRKNVIETREVNAVLAEMGPIEADTAEASGPGVSGADAPRSGPSHAGKSGPEPATAGFAPPRRLYRIHDGAMVSGVCTGMAAYLHIDPVFLRLAFVLMTLLGGSGVLVYFICVIVIPEANTPEEKAAAAGDPTTAQEFIRRAREGYYEAMKSFPDRKARREWQRQFKREMRQWRYSWRHNWCHHWYGPGWTAPMSGPAAPAAPVPPGAGFALPFLSLLHGVATILWICALVSLLSNGTILGLELPSKIPVWLAAVLLCLAYSFLVGPLKMARHACHWSLSQSRWGGRVIFFVDATIGIIIFIFILFLAIHFFPALHDAIQGIPAVVHQGVHDIRSWWNKQ